MSGVLTMTNRLHIIGQNSIWLASNNTAKINIDSRSTGDGAQLHKWNRNYQDTAYLNYYEQWYDGNSYHSIGVSGDRWKLSDGLDVSGSTYATSFSVNSSSTQYMTNGSWGWRHQTPHGYIEFGPANTSHAHIYTDRSNFYFNVNTLYANGNTIWHAGNDGAGSGLDADTVDGYSAAAFVSGHNGFNRNIQAEVGALHFYLDGGNSGQSAHSYAIFQEAGAWSHPYPDLRIAYHTGIKIGGHYTYGGTRFYNNSDMVTELLSVGNGDNHVRISNSLFTSGDNTSSSVYHTDWVRNHSNNNGHYWSNTGWHLYPQDTV